MGWLRWIEPVEPKNGGRELRWEGRVDFIGCVTEAVDELGMGALGERFLLYRMPMASEADDLEAGALALTDGRNPLPSLEEATTEFARKLKVPATSPVLRDEDREWLTLLASFVTRIRSTVIWDSRYDSVLDVPQPERSPRLLLGCAQLLRALRLIGCAEPEAWQIVRHTALGSIRTRKRRVVAALLAADLPMASSGIAARARLPETGVRRDLAEMDAFGIVEKVGDSPPRWILSNRYRTWWDDLLSPAGVIDLATLT